MWDQITLNKRRSAMMMIVFVAFVLALGYVFGRLVEIGWTGVIIAAGIAVVSVWGSYFYSDRVVLAITGARPATKEENAYLVNSVEGLAIAAGIPPPRIFVIDSAALNAFATGRDHQHAVVAVTTGLLARLNRAELEGVIAHEMSHVKNYDVRLQTLAVTLVGVVALLADWMRRSFFWGGMRRDRDRGGGALAIVGLLLAIFAPIVAQLLRLALSREREFLADANGALLTRYPEGLASALEKIAHDSAPLTSANTATAHLFIENPLKTSARRRMSSLFNTHPPIEERISRLREL